MFKEIIRKISYKSHNKIMLGRWRNISPEISKNYDENIHFNIDSANHDHCGSELCNKIKVKKNNIIFKEEEMFPYIL